MWTLYNFIKLMLNLVHIISNLEKSEMSLINLWAHLSSSSSWCSTRSCNPNKYSTSISIAGLDMLLEWNTATFCICCEKLFLKKYLSTCSRQSTPARIAPSKCTRVDMRIFCKLRHCKPGPRSFFGRRYVTQIMLDGMKIHTIKIQNNFIVEIAQKFSED